MTVARIENNAEEEDDHRPPRERRIVVADRREEAPEGVSQAEAPSVGGRLREGHPLGGVWSVQRALTRARGRADRERRARPRYLAVCSDETVLGANPSCRRRVSFPSTARTTLHSRVVE